LVPDGLGVGWTTHFLPFQRSASVTVPFIEPELPTAVQAVADRHDTPVSSDSSPCGCCGVAWTDHFAPFQCSARVSDLESEILLSPTAVQEVADEQDTPSNSLPLVTGFGLDCSTHLVPFQRSATVSNLEPVALLFPTAVQAVADEQDTPTRTPSLEPDGFGVGWTTHLLPFQRSASVPLGPYPTAMQALAEEHDTPYRAPTFTRGIGWTTHFLPFQRSASVTIAPYLGA